MNDIRLGNPSIPVTITEHGTCLAGLADIWQGAIRYAELHNYNVLEDYGVIGVAPFIPERARAWLGYLQVPFDEPVEVYKQNEDDDSTWVAEWMIQ